MARIEGGVNLRHGTLTKIAKRRKLSVTHVRLVAKGERDGTASLIAAILRERDRQLAEQATSGAPEPHISDKAA